MKTAFQNGSGVSLQFAAGKAVLHAKEKQRPQQNALHTAIQCIQRFSNPHQHTITGWHRHAKDYDLHVKV